MKKSNFRRQSTLRRRLASQALEQRKLLAADLLSVDTGEHSATDSACEFVMEQAAGEVELTEMELSDAVELLSGSENDLDSMIYESSPLVDVMMQDAVFAGIATEPGLETTEDLATTDSVSVPATVGMSLVNNGTIYIGSGFDVSSLQDVFAGGTFVNNGTIVFGDLPDWQPIETELIEADPVSVEIPADDLDVQDITFVTDELVDDASGSIDVSVDVEIEVDVDLEAEPTDAPSPDTDASDTVDGNAEVEVEVETDTAISAPTDVTEIEIVDAMMNDTFIVIGGQIEINEVTELSLTDLGLQPDATDQEIEEALNQLLENDTLEYGDSPEEDMADEAVVEVIDDEIVDVIEVIDVSAAEEFDALLTGSFDIDGVYYVIEEVTPEYLASLGLSPDASAAEIEAVLDELVEASANDDADDWIDDSDSVDSHSVDSDSVDSDTDDADGDDSSDSESEDDASDSDADDSDTDDGDDADSNDADSNDAEGDDPDGAAADSGDQTTDETDNQPSGDSTGDDSNDEIDNATGDTDSSGETSEEAEETDSQPESETTDSDRFDAEVLRLVNEARAEEGLAPLTMSEALDTAADQYSDSMAEGDFFAHTGIDGSDAGDRIMDAGYQPTTWGENLAAGQQTPEEVVEGWLNSPGHRANILNPSFTQMGLGYTAVENDQGDTRYGTYWTQTFGAGTEIAAEETTDESTNEVVNESGDETTNEIGDAEVENIISDAPIELASFMSDAMSAAYMPDSSDTLLVDSGGINSNVVEFLDQLFMMMSDSLQNDSLPVVIDFEIAVRPGGNGSHNDEWFSFLGQDESIEQDDMCSLLHGDLLMGQLA